MTLAHLLRSLRNRVSPDVVTLGSYERATRRCGRSITQEELAEAIGTTREWYAMLESGKRVRASTALLDRLADVLGLDANERANLFNAAIPELRQRALSDSSKAALEGFTMLRTAAKALASATSEADALAVAGEELTAWFDDAKMVAGMRRFESGLWDRQCIVDRGVGAGVREIWAELTSTLSLRQNDDFLNFPALSQPGDVGTPALYRSSPAIRARNAAYARQGIVVMEFIHGTVRTSRGLVAGIHVKHDAGRRYSESDRAVVGAMAEITSLALS